MSSKKEDLCGLKEYQNWLVSAISNDRNLADYECPNCNSTIKTLIPKEGEYDSMCCCPFCRDIHFKIADIYGNVTLKYSLSKHRI